MAAVQVSEAEKVYIMHGVRDDLRLDGRGCEDYRHMEIETDVVTSGFGHTDVLVGVKAEIGKPKAMVPDEGYLEFFVDCNISKFVFHSIFIFYIYFSLTSINKIYFIKVKNNRHSVDLRSLCICPGENCWVLYVDVLLLQFYIFHLIFYFISALLPLCMKCAIPINLPCLAGKRVGKALHVPLMELLQKEESLGKKQQKVGFLG
uniref:Ribosomal RNA-processing protein 42 n=1 Tax=Sinocyclocheilus rhinocerous TaxID=307959 RepID=A0A673IRC3_9TELE